MATENLMALVRVVHLSFYRKDKETTERVWLTLQCVMEQIMEDRGGNNYNLKHISKEKLIMDGRLPRSIMYDRGIVERAQSYVRDLYFSKLTC